MSIDVYTAPSCMACFASMRVLDKNGVPYNIYDVSDDQGAMSFVRELGHNQAPVIVTDDDHWSGHDPGKLKALIEAHSALAAA